MEEKNSEEQERIGLLLKKYNIDLEALKREQIKIASQIELKDAIDFSLADRFAGVDNRFIGNKMLSCVIVCDKNYEVIDRAYSYEKVRFPYIPGFRNYRELMPMINAFEKLSEKPDVVLVPAQGIIHPRLGLASHLSLSIGVPVIGVSNVHVGCEVEGMNVLKTGKIVGKVFISKPGSKPMYISPGNGISIEKSLEIIGGLINLPHKKPEPMHLAGKYAREVIKELGLKGGNSFE